MKDLTDLPKRDPEVPDGFAREPLRFGDKIVQAWFDDVGTRPRPMSVPDRRYRASWAGGCWRNLAYKITETEPSNPSTVADYWRMNTGSLIHDIAERYAEQAFGVDLDGVEVGVDLRVIDIDGAATGDITLVLAVDGRKIVIEMKTIGGFGFKMLESEGPRFDHITQGALAAAADDADELVILYLAMENISAPQAIKQGIGDFDRFIREFTFTPEQWKPYVGAEQFRVKTVLERLDGGASPDEIPPLLHGRDGARFVPKGAVITTPKTGTWVVRDADDNVTMTGKTWLCSYCDFRDRCIKAGT